MTDAQTNGSGTHPPELISDIRDPAMIRALADPTRLAILSAIAWGNARTVREVAERVGRRPGSLYRHFDTLERLGLIACVGTIGTARRDAKVYEADAELGFVYEPGDSALAEAITSVVASAARNATREFARSADSGATTRGPLRDTHMATAAGWLTDADLERFNGMLDEMREFLMSRGLSPGTRLIQMTTIVAPDGRDRQKEGEER
ncbi:MAG: helix-turn-helix domain-containing protein [Planctomycetota bacterium]